MRKRGQASHMNGRDEHARGNTNRLRHVVVLDLAPIGRNFVMLRKNDNEVRSGFQIGLSFVCPQWGQSIEPLFGSTSMVETMLLLFRSCTNLCLYLRIADDYEMPGLLIGAARSASRNVQTILDHL